MGVLGNPNRLSPHPLIDWIKGETPAQIQARQERDETVIHDAQRSAAEADKLALEASMLDTQHRQKIAAANDNALMARRDIEELEHRRMMIEQQAAQNASHRWRVMQLEEEIRQRKAYEDGLKAKQEQLKREKRAILGDGLFRKMGLSGITMILEGAEVPKAEKLAKEIHDYVTGLGEIQAVDDLIVEEPRPTATPANWAYTTGTVGMIDFSGGGGGGGGSTAPNMTQWGQNHAIAQQEIAQQQYHAQQNMAQGQRFSPNQVMGKTTIASEGLVCLTGTSGSE